MKKKIWIIVLASVAAIALIITAVVALSSGGTKKPWQEQYDLGVRYLNEGNYEEAVIAFTAAIEIDPRNPDLYIGRANAYTEMGDIASARADYETALEIDDTLADAWLGLAETYAAEGNIEKALEVLHSAVEKTNDARIKAKIEELETKLTPSHVHTWLDATCTEPKTCFECGETEGEPLGHDMLPATTDAPSICSRCGYTEGEPLASEITWTLENGTLTISGVGRMESCVEGDEGIYSSVWPWANQSFEIERVIIENGVTTIGNEAFQGCYNLTSVVIPNSVMTISDWALSWCSNLTSIEIPDSMMTIGENAFCACDQLQRINVETGNQYYVSIDGVLFSRDMTLLHTYPAGKEETSYEIPDSVTTIGSNAFDYCFNLTIIKIPNSVTTIDNEAFFDCESLTSVEIPNSVTTIGNYAFCGCNNLTSVVVPNSVTTIGEGTFEYCGSLQSIYVEAGNQYYVSVDGVLFSRDMTLLHTYPAGKEETSYEIPDSVMTISDQAFGGCYNLTSVEIPNSVTTIGEAAFYNCRNLTSVVIPNSVTTIGVYAFRDCYNLTSVEIPNSVTTIGEAAFCGCNLTSVVIPNSVTTIGDGAFSSCENLQGINVETGNQKYVSVDGVLYSRDMTLLHTYPAGKEETSYEIPDSVMTISDQAFGGCYNLTSVMIPNSVTTIGSFAFYDCDNLTSVVIPNNVTTIGVSAFYCHRLTNIYYGGTTEQWAAIAADADVPETTTIHYNYSN